MIGPRQRHILFAMTICLLMIINPVFPATGDEGTVPAEGAHYLGSGSYIENKGQFDDGLLFIGTTGFGRIGFCKGSVLFDVRDGDGGSVVRYEFQGADPVVPKGSGDLIAQYNYFIGNDPGEWVTGSRSFEHVVYEDLYDGIDLVYGGREGMPKYEFRVAPGADPGQIAIRVEGGSIRTDGENLFVETPSGTLVDSGLLLIQGMTMVKGSFKPINEVTFGFEVGDYDMSRELIIDPEISYSSMMGGTGMDTGIGTVVDTSAYIYVLSHTSSSDFPMTAGTYDGTLGGSGDLLISKLDPSGSTLIAATYFGGTSGEDYSRCGIALGTDGNIVVGGDTRAEDLPITAGSFDQSYGTCGDMYVACFNSDLDTLVFSTWLGGHETDYFGAITVADDGTIYVTGGTESTDSASDPYPTSASAFRRTKGESGSGSEDPIVSRISQDGSTLLASTYLGGDGDDRGTAIRTDADGKVYVAGWTEASDFPTTTDGYDKTQNGNSDCFACVFDASLTTQSYSTFFGGPEDEGGDDTIISMDVGETGTIYLAGYTTSTNLPTDVNSYQESNGGSSDGFVAAIQGNTLLKCTYFGGTGLDLITGLVLDNIGNVIMVGASGSTDYPLTLDAQQKTMAGAGFIGDCSFSILAPDLSTLYYSTYYGGNADDMIRSVLCTPDGSLYFSGSTASNDYPVTHDLGALPDTNGNSVLMMCGGFSARDPTVVHSLDIYCDVNFTEKTAIRDHGETLYIEIKGTDANATTRDGTRVNLTYIKGSCANHSVWLRETDLNTGTYRGSFRIMGKTAFYENVTVYSKVDPAKRKMFTVDTPVRLTDLPRKVTLNEHDQLYLDTVNLGWCEEPIWNWTSNAPWLTFASGNISGIPVNKDVGKNYYGFVNITNGMGRYSEEKVLFEVLNLPPTLIGTDILSCNEDEYYEVDFDCDEDGEGKILYRMETVSRWLSIDVYNGTIYGTPGNNDLGEDSVYLQVDDGNGGISRHRFNVTVNNINDRPKIKTADVTKISQGTPLKMRYEVEDIDPGDSHTWYLFAEGVDWLAMSATGSLNGTPTEDDIGVFHLNITVMDSGGLSDSHEFDLTVENVNDAPRFVDAPVDASVLAGMRFTFDVNATDPDRSDAIEYSISSVPQTDISIDNRTGLIDWEASLSWFDEPPYEMRVTVEITDGKLKTATSFDIDVMTTLPPASVLVSPPNGKKVGKDASRLEWTGSDPENDPIKYDIYLGESEGFVISLKSELRIISGYSGTGLDPDGLEPGKKYYWTVIPNDGGSDGTCSSGVFSFTLNKPPKLPTIELQQAFVGEQFKLSVKAGDDDQGDLSNLVYSLEQSPEGMTIASGTGLITWTPRPDQAMLFSVIVNASDGYDKAVASFTIEVHKKSAEGGSGGLVIMALVAVVILLCIGVVLFLVIRKRSKGNKEEQEEHVSVKDEDKAPQVAGVTNVPLTPTEAHAHLGKGSKKVSYEELYGAPAPQTEMVDMTTTELRDYIHDQVQELEELKEE
jgi:hypothetical protein